MHEQERSYSLAIVEQEEPIPEVHLVESSNILEYLLQLRHLPGNLDEFSPHLELSWAKPFLQELHDTANEVYIFDEETRDKMTKEIDPSIPEADRMVLEFEQEKSREAAELKAKGERSRVLYYVFPSGDIGASALIHGEFTKTKDELAVYFKNAVKTKQYPILGVHSHPNTVMFSPPDYLPLLNGSKENGFSLCKGLIVMTPDMQILALTTAQTPRYAAIELDDVIQKMDGDFLQTDRDVVVRATQELAEAYMDRLMYMRSIASQVIAVKKELKEKIKLGEIAEEDMSREIDKIFKQEKGIFEEKDKKLKGANVEYRSVCNQATVRGLMILARSLNIKLYSSTDMEHFKEFSA